MAVHFTKTKQCVLEGDDCLKVTWLAGGTDRYPIIWLRDHCQCKICYNPVTQSKMVLLEQLNLDTKVKTLKISVDKKCFSVTWDDGHMSRYSFNWLKERSFTDKTRLERRRFFNLEMDRVYWSSKEIADKLQMFNFDNLMNDDETLYKWLVALETVGICKVQDVPIEIHQIHKLAQRITWLRRGNYGGFFEIKVSAKPINVAHIDSALNIHTDNPFYENRHGVMMFHSISHTTDGGESLFTDGFRIAEILKKTHPDYYKILSETFIEYCDVGLNDTPYHHVNAEPIFVHDASGRLKYINCTDFRRSPYMTIPVEKVKTFYKALKEFNRMMYSPEHMWEYKLQGGEMICFDNYRLLHGRNAFSASEHGERHMQGGYVEWDDAKSMRRVLEATYSDKGVLITRL